MSSQNSTAAGDQALNMCTWGYFPYSNHKCVYGEYRVWRMSQPVWQQHKESCLWYRRAVRAKCLWLPPPPGSQGKQSPGKTHFHCGERLLFSPLARVSRKVKPCFCCTSYFSLRQPQPLLGFAQGVILCSLQPLLCWLISKLGFGSQGQRPHPMEIWVEQLSIHYGSRKA